MPTQHDQPLSSVAVAARSRPALLRALGRDDPPTEVAVDGIVYRREEIFKHDSWAATALYESNGRKIVCKFNRRQSFLGVPGAWIGRILARREAHFLNRLAGETFVPRVLGPVRADGKIDKNAVARAFIDGHPLGSGEAVGDDFFERLSSALQTVHARDMAYVDLHKRENVLVGADGRPYLIDFQVSFGLPSNWLGRMRPARALLQMLQRMDRYHCDKLFRKFRPDLCRLTAAELAASRPWSIRVHRVFGPPLRWVRRRFLTLLGVRTGRGKVESERFVEAGLRKAA
jgi:predicted Ser/Thr protein kinase